MKILAIETSCDETALALIDATGNQTQPLIRVIDTALYSQAATHAHYGGVFPSVAKREHAKRLVPLLEVLLKNNNEWHTQTPDTNTPITNQRAELQKLLSREIGLYESLIQAVTHIKKPDIDMIAVTIGPGLEPALWVGINFARALSLVWNIPIIPVNHMEGHIVSVLKQAEEMNPTKNNILFPAIALLISGGHTELVLVKQWGNYTVLGATKDDAVGEAFDKVARLLGFPYPGGPHISAIANTVREKKIPYTGAIPIQLPRPMIHSDDLHFSFSGLKTAVLYLVQKLQAAGEMSDNVRAHIAYEFENAATDVLCEKTKRAIHLYDARSLIVGGGVIANRHIRDTLTQSIPRTVQLFLPDIDVATDNAVMIGIAGFLKSFNHAAVINPELVANGNLGL